MVFNNLHFLILKFISSQKFKKKFLIYPKTKQSLKFVFILKKEGFILGFNIFRFELQDFIKIFLKYFNFLPVVLKLKIISKPSKRIFLSAKSISKITLNRLLILHTNRGLLTNKQSQCLNIGGEVAFFIV
jgi:small subunit ribosomal protein S8